MSTLITKICEEKDDLLRYSEQERWQFERKIKEMEEACSNLKQSICALQEKSALPRTASKCYVDTGDTFQAITETTVDRRKPCVDIPD